MSFICANCHVATPPRTPAIPIITKTRKVQYLNGIGEPSSKGVEVVTEIRVCPGCAEDFKKG